MIELLRSHGEHAGVEIYRHEGIGGSLSGVIFGAEAMLVTARHVVDRRTAELPGFEFFPEYDSRDIDIAVKKDPGVKGPRLGYVDRLTVANCFCIVSRAGEPDKLIRVDGNIEPFYEPTLLSRFVPKTESDRALFESGTSGSPIIYQGAVIGLIKGSSLENGLIVGVCFNLAELRTLLTERLNLSFVKI